LYTFYLLLGIILGRFIPNVKRIIRIGSESLGDGMRLLFILGRGDNRMKGIG
jgi:hypothetical protein